jgi:hypothetical protein
LSAKGLTYDVLKLPDIARKCHFSESLSEIGLYSHFFPRAEQAMLFQEMKNEWVEVGESLA